MCAHRLETYNYIRTSWKSGPRYVSDAPRSVIAIIEKALTAQPVSEDGEVLRASFDEEHALAILSVQLTPSPSGEANTEDGDNVFIHAVATNEVAYDDLTSERLRELFESVYGTPLTETITARQEEFSEVDFPRDRECALPFFIKAERIREIFPSPAPQEEALPLSALLRSQGSFADRAAPPPKKPVEKDATLPSAERATAPLDLPFEPSPEERHAEPMGPTNPKRYAPAPLFTGLILGSLALGSLLGALFIIAMLLMPTELGSSLRESLGLAHTASLPDPAATEEQRVAYKKLIDSYESQIRFYRTQSRMGEVTSKEPAIEAISQAPVDADLKTTREASVHAPPVDMLAKEVLTSADGEGETEVPAPVTDTRSTPIPVSSPSPAITTPEPSATTTSQTTSAENPPEEEVLLPALGPPGLFDIVIHDSSFLRQVPAVDGHGPLRILQDGERYTVTGVISQDDGRWFELRYGWIKKSSRVIKHPLSAPNTGNAVEPPRAGEMPGTSLPPDQLAYPGLFKIRIEHGINIYPAPSTTRTDQLRLLRDGEEYTVISEQVTPEGIWYEIRYGWVKQTGRTRRVDTRNPRVADPVPPVTSSIAAPEPSDSLDTTQPQRLPVLPQLPDAATQGAPPASPTEPTAPEVL